MSLTKERKYQAGVIVERDKTQEAVLGGLFLKLQTLLEEKGRCEKAEDKLKVVVRGEGDPDKVGPLNLVRIETTSSLCQEDLQIISDALSRTPKQTIVSDAQEIVILRTGSLAGKEEQWRFFKGNVIAPPEDLSEFGDNRKFLRVDLLRDGQEVEITEKEIAELEGMLKGLSQ